MHKRKWKQFFLVFDVNFGAISVIYFQIKVQSSKNWQSCQRAYHFFRTFIGSNSFFATASAKMAANRILFCIALSAREIQMKLKQATYLCQQSISRMPIAELRKNEVKQTKEPNAINFCFSRSICKISCYECIVLHLLFPLESLFRFSYSFYISKYKHTSCAYIFLLFEF